MGKKKGGKRAGRAGDAAVQARTGKTWREWFKILDAAGAKNLDHKGIVAYLGNHYPKLGGWWQQMVAVAYEQERGLREKYQGPTGYGISVSKTFAVSVPTLYRAWQNPKARGRWLEDAAFVIRKATPSKSMRITWVDGKTSVDVGFHLKGRSKSQISVQHSKLADARAAARMKTYWAQTLERLKGTLEA